MIKTEIELATRRRPENLTAYDLSLRAMQQYYLATREGGAEAMRLAHRALELDPRFGAVAALAGICHIVNVLFSFASQSQVHRHAAGRRFRVAFCIDDGDPYQVAVAFVI